MMGGWHTAVNPAQQNLILGGGDSGGYNPANATPFYFGLSLGNLASDPTTTAPSAASVQYPAMLCAATIRSVYLSITVGGVAGTTEFGTGAIRINNGTDSVVFSGTLQWNTITQAYVATGLSILLAPGDFFSFKITPPTWVTKPTVTFYAAQIVMTFP